MYIHEAIRLALEKKCYIRRKDDVENFGEHTLYFEPTNGLDCIIIHPVDVSRKAGPRWNPDADDLMYDGWELYIKK